MKLITMVLLSTSLLFGWCSQQEKRYEQAQAAWSINPSDKNRKKYVEATMELFKCNDAVQLDLDKIFHKFQLEIGDGSEENVSFPEFLYR